MASSVAGHQRAFGEDTVPGTYEDLEEADLVVLVGSNLAWCHPVLYQRLAAAKRKRAPGMKIVVIDPRRTATCEIADLHLALKPGSDVALFNGLLAHLARANARRSRLCRRAHVGLRDARWRAAAALHRRAGRRAGCRARRRPTAHAFYELFAPPSASSRSTARASTSRRTAPTRSTPSSTATWPPAASASPAWGRSRSPASPTPWAGARSAASPTSLPPTCISTPETRSTGSAGSGARPRIADKPGLKAVDMFRAVGDGRIKALWIMGTNPVVSMPDADAGEGRTEGLPLRRGLRRLPAPTRRAWPHVLLPSRGLGREGRHGDQFRAPHLAPAPLPPAARRGAAGLVASSPRSPGAWGSPTPSPGRTRPRSSAEHAALSACENDGARDVRYRRA